MTIANVIIDSTDPTDVLVQVNGQRVKPSGFGFYGEVGQVPRLVLDMPASTLLEGIADVSIGAPATMLAALEDVLSGVDAEQLGQRALDSMGMGDVSVAQAIVDEIRKMVASYGT